VASEQQDPIGPSRAAGPATGKPRSYEEAGQITRSSQTSSLACLPSIFNYPPVVALEYTLADAVMRGWRRIGLRNSGSTYAALLL